MPGPYPGADDVKKIDIPDYGRDPKTRTEDVAVLTVFFDVKNFFAKFTDQSPFDVVHAIEYELSKNGKRPRTITVFGEQVSQPAKFIENVKYLQREGLANDKYDLATDFDTPNEVARARSTSIETWIDVFKDWRKNNKGVSVSLDMTWTMDGVRYKFYTFFNSPTLRKALAPEHRRTLKRIGIPVTSEERENARGFQGKHSQNARFAAMRTFRKEHLDEVLTPETTIELDGVVYEIGKYDVEVHDPHGTFALSKGDLKKWDRYAQVEAKELPESRGPNSPLPTEGASIFWVGEQPNGLGRRAR
jgi:hypothetical protein